jgi:phosphatidylinositol alpha-1,6-mannosyltransferase
VLALNAAGAGDFDRTSGLDVVRSRRTGLPYRLAVALLNTRALLEALRFKPGVVLNAHIVTAPAAALIGALMRVPVVLYLYADEVAERPRLAGFAARSADAIVSISRHTSELAVQAGADARRLRLIPPGVDVPEDVVRRRDSGPPTVVTIARINERYKGHDTILRALPLVLEDVPDARWVVIGDGPLRPEFEEIARSHGLQDHVRFTGLVPDDERDAWLQRADVFVLASRLPVTGGGEGFGIVFLEAAAHGVPSVAGDAAGVRDAVVDGETGILVDPTDHVALARAVSSLLLDPERTRALGRNARARAERFAWPIIAAQVEQLALELISESAA